MLISCVFCIASLLTLLGLSGVRQCQAVPWQTDLLGNLVQPRDVIVYVNPEGEELAALSNSLGKEGIIVAINIDDNETNQVAAILKARGLWNRSLIINPNAALSTNSATIFQPSTNLFSRLKDALGGRCPSLMVFRYKSSYKMGVYLALVRKAMRLAIMCESLLSFNSVDIPFHVMEDSYRFIEHLGFSIFRSTAGHYENTCDPNSTLLIAHPSHALHSKLLSNQLLYRVHFDHTLCTYGRLPSTGGCREGMLIEAGPLVRPFTLTHCMLNTRESNILSSTIFWLPRNRSDDASLSMQCAAWVEVIASELPLLTSLPFADRYCGHPYTDKSSSSLQAILWEELDELVANCFEFTSRRLRMLASLQALHSPSGYSPSAKTNMSTMNPSITYHGYDVHQVNLSAMFKRLAFGVTMDLEACGEPIWCQYTIAMQEKLHNWQFPALRANHPAEQNFHLIEPERSCENSKFLVYEVPASRHGLGSMLMIIATMVRYATCLDRILVLNMRNQSPKLLKWRHPGCTGSVWECYFEPITHCDLSADVLAHQPVYDTDRNFDIYPLKDQRILILKEVLPSLERCAICYADWDLSSRFWHGTYLPGYNNEVMSFDEYSLHFGAFAGTVKLTWVAQILRFVMRPRPWFQQALDQLVAYSIHSPSSTGNMSLPERFISLHVRYGAKAIEVDLKPLARYMTFIKRKLPDLRDIFLSTETERVISDLTR